MKMSNMIIGNVYVAVEFREEGCVAVHEAIREALRKLKDKMPEFYLDWDLDMDEIDGFDNAEEKP